MIFRSDIRKAKTILLLYVLSYMSLAQGNTCDFTDVLQVEAPSGMRIRERPELTARPIAGVPYKAKVDACTETFGKATIEGVNGSWRLVRFKNAVGYMWDGFTVLLSSMPNETAGRDVQVEPLPQTASADDRIAPVKPEKPASRSVSPFSEVTLITESYPYCRDITAIDRSLFYYSVYLEDDYYDIRPVELSIELRKSNVRNAMHFDIKPSEGDGSLFIIGLPVPFKNWKKIKNNDFILTQVNRTLTPGVRLDLYPSEPGRSLGNIRLMAAGTVKSYVNDCPVIENYSLLVEMMLEGRVAFDISDQITHVGKCGVPDLYWFGDLNQDGYTDFILVGEYPKYTGFTLFFSQPDNVQRYKKVSEWVVEDCD